MGDLKGPMAFPFLKAIRATLWLFYLRIRKVVEYERRFQIWPFPKE
jgi:hypothetical protein